MANGGTFTGVAHELGNAATHFGGEQIVHIAAETGSATATAGLAGGFGAVWTSTGLGLAAVASAVINVIKYSNLRSDVMDTYREEIAAKLGKNPAQITKKDMDAVAETNPVLNEELQKLKRDRNLGIAVTVFSILCALPIAFAVMQLPAMVALSGFANFAAKVAVGFVCHKLVEYPVEAAGKKMFEMEGHSTHERIEDLIKERDAGVTLSKEQVLGVFVSARPALSQAVKQSFGEEYDKLDLRKKQAVFQLFEQHPDLQHSMKMLQDFTAGINGNNIRVSELAFAAVGQRSGVAPDPNPKPRQANAVAKTLGMAHHLKKKCVEAVQNIRHHKHEQLQDLPPQAPPALPKRKVEIYEQNERKDGKTFSGVEMMRRNAGIARSLEPQNSFSPT